MSLYDYKYSSQHTRKKKVKKDQPKHIMKKYDKYRLAH